MELGRHILLEFVRADVLILNDEAQIRALMLETAELIHATVLHTHFHRFEPHGITGILAIAESHLSIHTWPEYAYAAVDIFTCGDSSHLGKAKLYLKEKLKAEDVHCLEVSRQAGPVRFVAHGNGTNGAYSLKEE